MLVLLDGDTKLSGKLARIRGLGFNFSDNDGKCFTDAIGPNQRAGSDKVPAQFDGDTKLGGKFGKISDEEPLFLQGVTKLSKKLGTISTILHVLDVPNPLLYSATEEKELAKFPQALKKMVTGFVTEIQHSTVRPRFKGTSRDRPRGVLKSRVPLNRGCS
ncbi:hypothetical protein DdX_02735 [Ditylenchus destructor]|uniref:Uncharacterized protein n=1 Tax=Ditylenchus destructor TaxID=166010 RepID=A0AAD4NER9_9BILA|nr:hypothetical protein DdX_02735 [Ditylenchus destructor]